MAIARRWWVALAALLVLPLLGCGGGSEPGDGENPAEPQMYATAAPQEQYEWTRTWRGLPVFVSGRNRWTRTGIFLAPGDKVSLTATGTVWWSATVSGGPDRTANTWGLWYCLGRPEEANKAYAGSSCEFTAEHAGSLLLGVPDGDGSESTPLSYYTDNRGTFRVNLTVTRGSQYPVLWTDKGAALTAYWNNTYQLRCTRQSLDRLTARQVNSVEVLVTWYQDTLDSNTVYRDPDRSPTDWSVRQAIRYAHGKGLRVLLKPHVDPQPTSGVAAPAGALHPRRVNPSDPTAWFASYKAYLLRFAQLAQEEGVECFSVGCELNHLTTPAYDSQWRALLAAVRRRYEGPLVYAANWYEEYQQITFWDALDYCGLDAYCPLSDLPLNAGDPLPLIEDLMDGWRGYSGAYAAGTRDWVAEIEAWQAAVGKPLLFTEVGYRSRAHCARDPWEYGDQSDAPSPRAQENAYEAFCQVWGQKSYVQGVYWWQVVPGEETATYRTGYCMLGRAAQFVMRDRYH